MAQVTGTVLLAQESRFRLLTPGGRGETFLLAHDAPIEPQDLPPGAGCAWTTRCRRSCWRGSPAA